MPAPGLGRLLAEGRTSEVFAFGSDSVVKIPRWGVPPHWSRVEVAIAEAVHRAGLPCPEVRDLIELGGRESIVFERIDGPSVWQLILERPREVDRFAALLVEIQRTIQQVGAIASVPQLGDRVRSKILAADGLTDLDRLDASQMMASLPPGAVLCHGDLHPGNILMSGGQPVVIDWFDAVIGVPGADLVRTSLLIRPPFRGRMSAAPFHLPGADPALLDALHRSYLGHAIVDAACDVEELLRWERVLAAARLSEHTTADRADLLALWQGGDELGPASVLAELLGRDHGPHHGPDHAPAVARDGGESVVDLRVRGRARSGP